MLKLFRLAAAMAAVIFLVTATPAAAATEDEGCPTCEQCYPGLPCYQCASYVVAAIGHCCGGGEGWSSCVSNEWGFYAQCNSGLRCQCDDQGGSCEALPRLPE